MSKVLQERGSESLHGLTDKKPEEIMSSRSRLLLKLTRPQYAEKPRMAYQFKASMNMHDSAILEDYLPPKEKDPGSFTIPYHINNICFEKALADLGASVGVIPYSTSANLGLGKLAPTKLIIELADRTIKHPNGIAENVLVGINKFVFPVDFIILDMPEDIKVLLILGGPFLSTAHAKIDVFKRKITLRVGDDKIVSLDPAYEDYIELNDLNESLELRRNQVEDLGSTIKEGKVIDEPMKDIVKSRNDDNEIIVENMDAYHDKEIGDVIVGKLFCREIDVKARRFNGMITIYNGNDSVTYQMARSHLRFKHLTNAQCNKMRPLLKVSARDKLNEILHPYQKLKSFYKGVLNLGPEYIRDAKIEELLTRGHVSIHEME
ncbi:gag-pol polyprotein [Tanacetum coccineum]